jgi:hypothetical protein
MRMARPGNELIRGPVVAPRCTSYQQDAPRERTRLSVARYFFAPFRELLACSLGEKTYAGRPYS